MIEPMDSVFFVPLVVVSRYDVKAPMNKQPELGLNKPEAIRHSARRRILGTPE